MIAPNEDLIPLMCVPNHIPMRANGKRLDKSAGYRWADRGVRGVRLETLDVGGLRYTSARALEKFFADCAARRAGVPTIAPTSNQRQRQIEAAEAELEEAGL